MKISKIKTHNLRNDAHFQFHAYCLNQDSQDYRINRINQINSLLNIGRHQAKRLGSHRTIFFLPIFESCESGFRQQVAAQPLNEETSAIYNILQELEGKYSREAETVGIKQWVAELKKRNNALSDLMKDRFDESASKSDIVVKEARAELDKAYRTIAEKIDALVIVEGAKTYENFIRTWNAVVEKYANGLRRRKGGDLSRPLSENENNLTTEENQPQQ